MAKYIILLCALAFVASEISAKSIRPLHFKNIQPFGLIDDAKALLKELEQKASTAQLAAISTIDELEARLKLINTQISVSGQVLLDKLTLNTAKELQTLEKTAEKVNADIDECVQGRSNEITQLNKTISGQMSTCLSVRNKNANADLEDSRLQVAVSERTVANAGTKLAKCGADEKCINEQIENIKNLIIVVPGELEQLKQAAATSLEQSGALLANCVTMSQYDLEDATDALVDDLQLCSKDIIAFFTKYIVTTKVQLRKV